MKYRVALFVPGGSNDTLTQNWAEEGFDVSSFALTGQEKDFKDRILGLVDNLEAGEQYGIVAYGTAAGAWLEAAQSRMPKLGALIAFYPDTAPITSKGVQPVQIHLAASQPFGTKDRSYVYPETEPGFAEPGHANFDTHAAGIAWSRALSLMRRAFGFDADIEKTWEDHLAVSMSTRDAATTVQTFIPHDPHVIYVPTGAGAFGTTKLEKFYAEVWFPTAPPSLKIKVLSHTVGADRIVDEMRISFMHSQEVAWLLPGIAATDKYVDIAMVVIVRIKGGKLVSEHMYYDQASVLAQIGLLPAELGGVKLPVLGKEAAQKLVEDGF